MFLPDPAPCGEVASPIPTDASVRPAARARLDDAERRVVLLARADARRYGWDGMAATSPFGARLRGLIVALTGIEPVRPLADRRLERLRLFACMMRRGDRRSGDVAETLLRDGFSEAALREAVGLALG